MHVCYECFYNDVEVYVRSIIFENAHDKRKNILKLQITDCTRTEIKKL